MVRLLFIAAAVALASCATTSDDSFDLFGSHLKGAQLEAAIAAASVHPLGQPGQPRPLEHAARRAGLSRAAALQRRQRPGFHRGGSVGEGPYGSILDVYELQCLSGQPATASVFMDMYHDHVEERPVPGFTIKPAS